MKPTNIASSRLRSPPAFQIYAEAKEFLTDSPREHGHGINDQDRLLPLEMKTVTQPENPSEDHFPRPSLSLGELGSDDRSVSPPKDHMGRQYSRYSSSPLPPPALFHI